MHSGDLRLDHKPSTKQSELTHHAISALTYACSSTSADELPKNSKFIKRSSKWRDMVLTIMYKGNSLEIKVLPSIINN